MIPLVIAAILLTVLIGGVVWAIVEPDNRTYFMYIRGLYRITPDTTEHFYLGVLIFSHRHVREAYVSFLEELEDELEDRGQDIDRAREVLRHLLRHVPDLVLSDGRANWALDMARARQLLDENFMPLR